MLRLSAPLPEPRGSALIVQSAPESVIESAQERPIAKLTWYR